MLPFAFTESMELHRVSLRFEFIIIPACGQGRRAFAAAVPAACGRSGCPWERRGAAQAMEVSGRLDSDINTAAKELVFILFLPPLCKERSGLPLTVLLHNAVILLSGQVPVGGHTQSCPARRAPSSGLLCQRPSAPALAPASTATASTAETRHRNRISAPA